MSFDQAAVRLAGGFTRAIDEEGQRTAIHASLPATPMGELERTKTLSSITDAAADTLRKVAHTGIDLAASAGDHPRRDAILGLEAAVLKAKHMASKGLIRKYSR